MRHGSTRSSPALALLLALLCACAARHPRAAVDEPGPPDRRYRIGLLMDVHTVVDGTDSSPWAAAPDEQTSLELLVRMSASRTFRDGSEGTLVEVVDARMGAGPTALTPGDATELAGRSFELRVFEGREILTADLVEHLVGPLRQLDAFDLLLPVMSPFPPPLDVGQSTLRPMRWPVVVAPDRFVRGAVSATWTNLGLVEVDGTSMWRLDYQGPWTGKLRDGRAEGRVNGSASGSVWVDAATGALARHDFDWTRQLEMRYPGAGSGVVRVVQDQHFVGQLQQEAL